MAIEIKIPFMVVAYGDFNTTKKLFYYERNGVCVWPVFFDANKADDFLTAMRDILIATGDDRSLSMQMCNDKERALDMLSVIIANVPTLRSVVINPNLDDTDELINITDFYLDMRSVSSESKVE